MWTGRNYLYHIYSNTAIESTITNLLNNFEHSPVFEYKASMP